MMAFKMDPRAFRIRSDWNQQGPPIPVWFRLALRRIDPALVLQFIPPRTEEQPEGVDPRQCPDGCWNICRFLRRSRLLHPVAVWSLTDMGGKYSPPGPDTIRMLRMAYNWHRRGELRKLEEFFDEQLTKWNQENIFAPSEKAFRKRFADTARALNCRQWQNRVFLSRAATVAA